MKRSLDLGFMALTDAAPLIIAREHGFFETEGLDVTLRREVSWATIRDRLAMGFYQGAHMLAPAMLAANLGAGSEPAALIAPLSLNAHGAAIGVSRELARAMSALDAATPRSAHAFALAAAQRRSRGQAPLTIAVVFSYSMHNYMLRYWAASAGLDPDRDIRIVVAAPTAIAPRLKAGDIDGFCVGAPWSAVCEAECGAETLLEAGAFWRGGPDKVLGVSAAWAAANPEATLGLTRAVLRAALWAGAPENADTLAHLLSRADLVNAPAEAIARGLASNDAARIRFARMHAAFPWPNHARWQLTQMLRWGQIDERCDFTRARDAYRPDLYRAAAAAIGVAAPAADHAETAPLDEPNPQSHAFDGESLRRDAAHYAITRLK